MDKKTAALCAAGAMMLLAVALAEFGLQAHRARSAALDAVLAQGIWLQHELANAENRLAEANRGRQGLKGVRARQNSGSPAKSRSDGAPVGTRSANGMALLRANPELQTLYLRNQWALAHRGLAQFFQEAGLSSDQIQKLEELDRKALEKDADLRWASTTPDAANDPAYAALHQQLTDQLTAGTKQILGESAYQQLQEYNRTGGVRYIVDELAGSVAATSTPLSAQQGVQLTQILADSSPQYQKGRYATVATVQWDKAFVQAQGILSTPQLITLKATLAQQQEAQMYSRLSQLVLQSQSN